ncbi:MAG: LacI family DNA-binding transcriptional regulator [Aestuariivita sp.]|nr:LacI family DNA-binding transcriptional regulator [Aestuariivita sp.]
MKNVEKELILPTMEDVARHAKVSTATVSRCLNTPDQVIPKTRKRVFDAISQLGYAPNFGARALAAKQTNTIGAIIPTMENAVFARGIQAFQEELGRHGKTLLIASSAYQASLEDEQVRALVARGAEALLLIGYDRDQQLYEFLQRRSIPTVITWSFIEAHDWLAVGFDNHEAMEKLANLVIDYGHRALACISAPTATNDRARGRVEGIRSAMVAHGLDPNSLVLVERPYGIENGEDAFRHLIARSPNTTAVLCGNDVLALGALREAVRMGLDVPRDISITGFDDIEVAMLAEPALTTVHVPHREMGHCAARVLIQMLNKETTLQSVLLPTEIRLRQSLGKPLLCRN